MAPWKESDMSVYTIPDEDTMRLRKKMVPGFMRPNLLPMAVVYAGVLNDAECDAIVKQGNTISDHKVPTCNATTRTFRRPLPHVLDRIEICARVANYDYWNFLVDEGPEAWMQTYVEGGDYHRHSDAEVGQTRKLTAVALLSQKNDYAGGNLILVDSQNNPHVVERTRGTVVVFPSWHMHEVTTITSGYRQTINMGWWGPPFR
jgi:hypothetical protein